MSAIFKRGRAEIEANLTPLIDVTFLLIVFFVLVSQIVTEEAIEMRLPEPEQAPTVRPGEELRIVINLVPRNDGSGKPDAYKVGSQRFPASDQGVAAMTEYIASLYQSNPDLEVNLRADQATHYEWVEPAMQAIVNASVLSGRVEAMPRVNLVVVQDQ